MRMRIVAAALCAFGSALILGIGGTAVSAQQPCDFLTGGGYIYPEGAGAKGNFGVAGGCKHGTFWGHLEYQDKGTGLKVHWLTITAYNLSPVLPDPKARLICGTARTNQYGDVDFAVRAKDAGASGSNDEFDIQLHKAGVIVYSTFVTPGFPHQLGGGNIELHKPNQSNSGSFGGACPALGVSQETATLTVIISGNGTGTVTSVPPGISCTSTCSASFAVGTVVTLTAVANQDQPDETTTASFTSGCTEGDTGPGVTSVCTVTVTASTDPVTLSFSFPE